MVADHLADRRGPRSRDGRSDVAQGHRSDDGLVRFDDEEDLASLLPNPSVDRPTAEEESWPDSFAELGESVAAKTKSTVERPIGS